MPTGLIIGLGLLGLVFTVAVLLFLFRSTDANPQVNAERHLAAYLDLQVGPLDSLEGRYADHPVSIGVGMPTRMTVYSESAIEPQSLYEKGTFATEFFAEREDLVTQIASQSFITVEVDDDLPGVAALIAVDARKAPSEQVQAHLDTLIALVTELETSSAG